MVAGSAGRGLFFFDILGSVLRTITSVSRQFAISTRTLRYYEQMGLLCSSSKPGYSYRLYSEESLQILEQIVVLRKLRIPLKQIGVLIKDQESVQALSIFRDKIAELSREIVSLSTIRSILENLVERIQTKTGLSLDPAKLADKALILLINSISITKITLKEEPNMTDLDNAHQQLSGLKDVRILYLPPSPVASIHTLSDSKPAEWKSNELLTAFVKKHDLATRKPDIRHYGFNHPNGEKEDGSDHGYERWVTIPPDLVVDEPFVKREFPGGLYAAHMIPMGHFEEWHGLIEWVKNSPEYEIAWGDPAKMGGLLEEHLNYGNQYEFSQEQIDRSTQLDLLVPIKRKQG